MPCHATAGGPGDEAGNLADPDQRIYEGFIRSIEDTRLQQAIDALHAPNRSAAATAPSVPTRAHDRR